MGVATLAGAFRLPMELIEAAATSPEGPISFEMAGLFVVFAAGVLTIWLFLDRAMKSGDKVVEDRLNTALSKHDSDIVSVKREIKESEERSEKRLTMAIDERRTQMNAHRREIEIDMKALMADLRLTADAAQGASAKMREEIYKDYVSHEEMRQLETRLIDGQRELMNEMRELRRDLQSRRQRREKTEDDPL